MAVRELLERKHAMISGLWANPNLDGEDKETRGRAIKQIDDQHNEAIRKIYGEDLEIEVDESHPFYAKMKQVELPDDFEAKREKGTPFEVDVIEE